MLFTDFSIFSSGVQFVQPSGTIFSHFHKVEYEEHFSENFFHMRQQAQEKISFKGFIPFSALWAILFNVVEPC